MSLYRFLELLPLALVLGTVMGALRHEKMADLQKAALINTAKILAWLILGSLALQAGLLIVQD